MANKIKVLLDEKKENPHWLSQQAGVTYRIVLRLYKLKEIPASTTIGTLWSIATALGVKVDDLYSATANGHDKATQ